MNDTFGQCSFCFYTKFDLTESQRKDQEKPELKQTIFFFIVLFLLLQTKSELNTTFFHAQ